MLTLFKTKKVNIMNTVDIEVSKELPKVDIIDVKAKFSKRILDIERKNFYGNIAFIILIAIMIILGACFAFGLIQNPLSSIENPVPAYAAIITGYFTVFNFAINKFFFDTTLLEKFKLEMSRDSMLEIENLKKVHSTELTDHTVSITKNMQKEIETFKDGLQKTMINHGIFMRNAEEKLKYRADQLTNQLSMLENCNKSIEKIIQALEKKDFIDALLTNMPTIQEYISNTLSKVHLMLDDIQVIEKPRKNVEEFIQELKTFSENDLKILKLLLDELKIDEKNLLSRINNIYLEFVNENSADLKP
jgi:hypothetical protein